MLPLRLHDFWGAHIRHGSELTITRHLVPRSMCPIMSAINRSSRFGDFILLYFRERVRQVERKRWPSSEALSRQGVRNLPFALGSPIPFLSLSCQGSWFNSRVELIALWLERWCGNLQRSLKFCIALHCFAFFLLQLVLSKFGYPMAESGHPDLLIALPMIMKSGSFFPV